MNRISAAIAVLALTTGAALAQTTPAADPIAQKFASLDADRSGFLDGKELEAFKDKLAFLDMNKDGKVSPTEFNVGVMSGLIAK